MRQHMRWHMRWQACDGRHAMVGIIGRCDGSDGRCDGRHAISRQQRWQIGWQACHRQMAAMADRMVGMPWQACHGRHAIGRWQRWQMRWQACYGRYNRHVIAAIIGMLWQPDLPPGWSGYNPKTRNGSGQGRVTAGPPNPTRKTRPDPLRGVSLRKGKFI